MIISLFQKYILFGHLDEIFSQINLDFFTYSFTGESC